MKQSDELGRRRMTAYHDVVFLVFAFEVHLGDAMHRTQ